MHQNVDAILKQYYSSQRQTSTQLEVLNLGHNKVNLSCLVSTMSISFLLCRHSTPFSMLQHMTCQDELLLIFCSLCLHNTMSKLHLSIGVTKSKIKYMFVFPSYFYFSLPYSFPSIGHPHYTSKHRSTTEKLALPQVIHISHLKQ